MSWQANEVLNMAQKNRNSSKKRRTNTAVANPPGVWLPGALALWNVRHLPEFANYSIES